MPGFTPGRRWQPAYYAFHNDTFSQKILATVERWIKSPLFGCRMCGNCLLQETAFICPMECPKGLRNGPCGGSTPEHCYVDNTRPCIWYKIYERSEKLGRSDRLLEVLPPLDWEKVGTEQWGDLFEMWKKKGGLKATFKAIASKDRMEIYEHFMAEYRQPEWWQGDDQAHPAPAHEPVSTLEKKLVDGKFVVTAEVAPPISATAVDLVKKITMLKDFVDALNFTDNPSATSRMSTLASSTICLQSGVEPVMQIAARDYNRMGIQSLILGAAALGIRNVLCLTGDHARLGPEPHSKMDIWDLDSIQLIWLLRRMRDEGHFLDQREIKTPPSLFIGAASSPNASEPRFQVIRETKKANAGAQFFQTNLIYDVDAFKAYLDLLDKAGILQRAHIMAGLTPIRSVKAAYAMNSVPGVKIPVAVIERLEKSADPKEEGVQVCLELIEKVKDLPVNGIHFMAVGWESIVPRLVEEGGLQTRRMAV